MESAPAYSSGAFRRKFLPKQLTQVRSPRVFNTGDLLLPKPSAIHYLSETGTELGPGIEYGPIRNIGERFLIHNVTEMDIVEGKVIPIRKSESTLARNYIKVNRNATLVRDVESSNQNGTLHMVVNYALLDHLYEVRSTRQALYYQWLNTRTSLWKTMESLKGDRTNFVRFVMPEILPRISDFRRFKDGFTIQAEDTFNELVSLDFLSLWTWLFSDESSVLDVMSETVIKQTMLVFSESGKFSVLSLFDLKLWANDDKSGTEKALYGFFESLIKERPAPITDEESEEESEFVFTTSTTESMIQQLTSSGLMSESEQKNIERLLERSKTITDPLDPASLMVDSIVTEEDISFNVPDNVPETPTIFDKEITSSTVDQMDEVYVKQLYRKDINNAILSIQSGGIIIRDVTAKQTRDAANDSTTYSVQVQPVRGKATTVPFTVPNIHKDGSFFANGVKYRLVEQRGDMPIAKIKPTHVGLTSYYGKIFVVRNENTTTNLSKWFVQQINKRSVGESPLITNVRYGQPNLDSYALPRIYTAIASMLDSFSKGDIDFYFNYPNIENHFKPEELKTLRRNEIPIGRKGGKLITMDQKGKVTLPDGPKQHITNLIDPSMGRGPIEYTEMSVYSKRVPVIIAYMYRYGFDDALKRLKLRHKTLSKGVRIDVDEDQVFHRVKLKDEDLIIYADTPEQALLVGGLHPYRRQLRELTGNALNKKAPYGKLLGLNGITPSHLREMDLAWDMFIDPITKDILRDSKEPTTFERLLRRASDLCVDDQSPPEQPVRYKRYERIAGFVYAQMIQAMRRYRAQAPRITAEFSMKPQAVWLDIIQDESVILVEESNPIHMLKERESTTTSGAGGRSSKTMVKSARGFNKNDMGVISEATPDSGKVGIRTYHSPDANFVNLRGITRPWDKEKDSPAKVLSTSALLAPAVRHDDFYKSA